jgi:hypothetical protein
MRPLSRQAAPAAKRSSSWRARWARSARTQISGIGSFCFERRVFVGSNTRPSPSARRIMQRLAERWSEATQGRSQLRILEDTELRDVLVVFNDKRVTPAAEARTLRFAGGRLRYVEVFAQGLVLGVDTEYTAGTLLHGLGHVLGCCNGPGTSGGHFVGPNCTKILRSPHGNARTFSEDELRHMGLGG